MLRKDKEACPNCVLLCANCDFYDEDLEIESYVSWNHQSITSSCGAFGPKVRQKGACRLNPVPVHKKLDDWCGQHSEYGKK